MTLWTPANLATLPTHWWDAQDDATLTLNVNAVSAWANKGSAGGTVTQATAANQPQRSTSDFGGRHSLSFSGSQFFSTIFPVGAAFRLYAVLNLSTGKLDQTILGGSSTFVPLASGPSTSGANNAEVWRINGTAFSGPRTVWRNAVSASVGTRSQIYAQLVGGQRIYSMRSLPAFTGYRLFEGGNDIFRPLGFIGEILLVPEAGLTQADDDLITGYLAWKWGLEGSLPADHPYKTAAPTAGPSANNATAASAFDLAGSSAAAIAIAAQGAGSLPLGGSAQAASQAQASAAASGTLPLAGSAVTQVRITASAAGSLELGGSAVAGGPGAVNASASGSIGFTGSAAAGVNITASVSGAISLTGSALAGAPDNGAVGAGSIALAGSSATSVAIRATGAGQMGLGGSSAVSVDIRAAAAGAIALTGAATAADRARVPSLVFSVPRESRLFLVEREQRVFAVAREQRIFTVIREAA